MLADAGLDACRWVFPDPSSSDEGGLVAVGADLEPATLLAAYSRGLFPMPLKPGGRIGWWSPPERGVLEPDGLIVHRSLRRACRRFEVRVDTAFAEVVDGCADPSPTPRLDRRSNASRVRAPSPCGPQPTASRRGARASWSAGSTAWPWGGLFAGESMFYRVQGRFEGGAGGPGRRACTTDISRLIDVQWATPHLRSLGVSAIPRQQLSAPPARATGVPAPGHVPMRPLFGAGRAGPGATSDSRCRESDDPPTDLQPAPSPPACRPPEAGVCHHRRRAPGWSRCIR